MKVDYQIVIFWGASNFISVSPKVGATIKLFPWAINVARNCILMIHFSPHQSYCRADFEEFLLFEELLDTFKA